MKAWRVHELGEPSEVMRLDEVDDPSPAPGQLLVRVLAAPVNFPDALLCRGQYQVRPPLPFTPGVELCGEVVARGDEAGGQPASGQAAVGDRVVALPALPIGAFGELTVVDARAALPAPPSLTDEAASTLLIGYQTAWVALHRRAHLQAGETLLVHAAAGGVGSAAVQLGKAAGARVIAVVGGEAKADVAERLGADLVVDRQREDFVEVVKQATDGAGADVVFDPVGGAAYAGSTKCIAFEGRIVVIGFASGEIPTPGLNHALIKNYSIVGLHWGLYSQRNPAVILQAHAELTRLAAEGVVAPLVSERVPLAGAADAVQRVADGLTVGRLVVVPA